MFMKGSAEIDISEISVVHKETEANSSDSVLHEALINFQTACLKQFKSYQEGVSMSLVEAEINKIREEILHHFQKKL